MLDARGQWRGRMIEHVLGNPVRLLSAHCSLSRACVVPTQHPRADVMQGSVTSLSL